MRLTVRRLTLTNATNGQRMPSSLCRYDGGQIFSLCYLRDSLKVVVGLNVLIHLSIILILVNHRFY